jgi:hypothetical protein
MMIAGSRKNAAQQFSEFSRSEHGLKLSDCMHPKEPFPYSFASATTSRASGPAHH